MTEKPAPRRRKAPAKQPVVVLEAQLEQSIVPYDENLLERARTQWQFGDWQSLAQLDCSTLQHHPERAKLALLAAAGRLQTDKIDEARQYIHLAKDWGVSKKLVSQILIAGVHNSIGRAAAIFNNELRATRHFELAIQLVTPGSDVALVGHARSVREMSNLGLLPQASAKIRQLHLEFKQACITNSTAHAKVLDLEVDILRDRIYSLQKQLDQSKINIPVIGSFAEAKSTNRTPHNTYHGLHELDRKLAAYLDYDNGYFVELGANDGIRQSNTFYFEKQHHWHGLLIEPILHNFLACKANRSPKNAYACAACVSFAYAEPHVRLVYANLMTTPVDLESDIADPRAHAESGKVYLRNGETPVEILAPARTLTALLDEAHAPCLIDLLSLDVEGAEIEVLKGIDHQRYRFKYLLIECRNGEAITAYLGEKGYKCIDKLSNHDYLYAEAG
jgi:FkbM family methyltransferase